MDDSDSSQSFEEMQTLVACARSAGARCRRLGMAITANPYGEDTAAGKAWAQAWWVEDEKRRVQA